MNIVMDSNILFAALIRNSTTKKIILDYEGFFLFPSLIFEEMQKHKHELLDKSGMTINDFNLLLSLLLKKVIIIPKEKLLPFKQQADELVKDIDPEDSIFVACALAYKAALWTDEKQLKKVKKITVIDTKKMMKKTQAFAKDKGLKQADVDNAVKRARE
jgi:predicted nucleic acid-binding protein